MGVSGELGASRSLRRIAVIGGVGSGKTTLAATIAGQLGMPHVELDGLRYEADWKPVADKEFHSRVAQYAGTDRWVIDGNYEATRDIVWVRADLVVWIDYSLPVIISRFVRRTIRRLLRREVFSAGKRERISRLFGRHSMLLWSIRSHGPRREKYEGLVASRRYAHAEVVRLRRPSATDEWLAKFVASNSQLHRSSRGTNGIEPRPSSP